jgi:hypothetical protein
MYKNAINKAMDTTELQRLAKKFLNGTASAAEKELLNKWYDTK